MSALLAITSEAVARLNAIRERFPDQYSTRAGADIHWLLDLVQSLRTLKGVADGVSKQSVIAACRRVIARNADITPGGTFRDLMVELGWSREDLDTADPVPGSAAGEKFFMEAMGAVGGEGRPRATRDRRHDEQQESLESLRQMVDAESRPTRTAGRHLRGAHHEHRPGHAGDRQRSPRDRGAAAQDRSDPVTPFVTEVQLGACGVGFSLEEIREQEKAVAEARRVVVAVEEAIMHFGGTFPSNAVDKARVALIVAEDRLAMMHLHNRLRAIEEKASMGPDPRYTSPNTR
jgi:hypothetical protein